MVEWTVDSNMLAMSTITPVMELFLERMSGGSLMPLLLQETILPVVCRRCLLNHNHGMELVKYRNQLGVAAIPHQTETSIDLG